LNDQAQRLLDRGAADFVFEEDGRPYVGPGTAALAWRLGPVPAENCVRAGHGLFGLGPLALCRLGVSGCSLALVTGR
jgi:hypothetical protein